MHTQYTDLNKKSTGRFHAVGSNILYATADDLRLFVIPEFDYAEVCAALDGLGNEPTNDPETASLLRAIGRLQ
jgi:hypothetical protein